MIKKTYSLVLLAAIALACSPYVLSKVTTSSITPDASHYIIVIPGTYHGIKITITLKDDTSFTIKSGVTFTVERGHYLDLGVLPSQPFDTPANGEIDFGGMAGHPEPGLFWHGKAVVPCGYQGLLLEK